MLIATPLAWQPEAMSKTHCHASWPEAKPRDIDRLWDRCHRTEPPPGNFLRGREYPKDKHSPQSGFPKNFSPPLVKILPPPLANRDS